MAGKSRPEALGAAFDELRFGPAGTLNLREGLPSADDARLRAERFLRQHQVRGTPEVLIVTGRGNQSDAGIPVIRNEIERLLFSLRRQGVIAAHQTHTPGSFVVHIAPIRAVVEAPPRRRESRRPRRPASIVGLSDDTTALLQDLAQCSLTALGVTLDEQRVEDEMQRQLSAIVRGLPAQDREAALRDALRQAIAEYD